LGLKISTGFVITACDGLVVGFIGKSSGGSVKQVIESTIHKALDRSAMSQFVKTLTETTNSIQQTLKSTVSNDVHMDISHSVADTLPTENRKVIDAVNEYVDRECCKRILVSWTESLVYLQVKYQSLGVK